ncbi:YvcK family protein [Aeromicrobium sp. CFBP 8757]|uniref:2-phospho-L-lactate transferase CofD family protein n=1 Tax=Aeromicrobium sp. CFBP 8757 TaxID=2775288 RepID=UPI001786E11D|nr:2-phospho-L-lactate transferase CofD family protein [Aeromicrobium sp. CFBP 8757]MBD8607838.1 YvcK family protein [Aeromicrobium sp. CFBP 8757]
MRITLISGADGAPFVHELAAALGPDDELTVVAPIVRDHWSAWLKACPDLDALLSPPGVTPTFAVADQLRSIDYSPAWQRASDQTVATRLVRTELLGTGYSLSQATLAAASRGGLGYRLLPMSDDRAELHVVVEGDDEQPRAVHVEEYLAAPSTHVASETVLVAEAWGVSSLVADELRDSDVVVLGPSSRTLAIDPVLRTPGLLDVLDDRGRAQVLVVEHDDTAPDELVRVAGLRADVPGEARTVAADVTAVVATLREVVAP